MIEQVWIQSRPAIIVFFLSFEGVGIRGDTVIAQIITLKKKSIFKGLE